MSDRANRTGNEGIATDGGVATGSGSRFNGFFGDLNGWRIALYVVLAALTVYFLIPIEAGIVTSFKTVDSVSRTAPYLPPGASGFTLKNWQNAVRILGPSMVNSAILTIPATILCAVFGSIAAYGLTQLSWRGQLPILMLFVAGVFIPYQAVLVPLSEFWSMVGLQDLLSPLWGLPLLHPYYSDLIELIITHTAYGIPICTVLFRGFYMGLSDEMVEAARLDGASVFRVYRRIVLPLSAPMFAVVLIFQFTQIWNDLLFALILIGGAGGQSAPVTLSLVGLGASMEGINFGLRMAGAFLTAFPTLLVFIVFGDQFAEGVAGRT